MLKSPKGSIKSYKLDILDEIAWSQKKNTRHRFVLLIFTLVINILCIVLCIIDLCLSKSIFTYMH